ncbi:MAG: Gfo/Idh/MocA family oxidoreductase [Candidatus Anammoximicrobium sp.]|nr:Gfo/Idh/MocA family oxidoreductase [Candidatus Anammoximicrobium sp.]
MNQSISRRRFVAQATWGSAGAMVLGRAASARSYAANDQIRLGLVGCTGRGAAFLSPDVVALCDVDSRRAESAFKRLPNAAKFEDFRVMLDKMGKQIDGVIVCTPDHCHAAVTAAAIRAGKHVYCEKPLTRTVHEARAVTELAAKHKVVTQMGNQGGYNVRAVELVRSGALGEIRTVHLKGAKRMGNANGGPRARKPGTFTVPEGFSWDLWMGPAAARPYHPEWVSPNWRVWRDFSGGDLGGWAPHLFATAFKALKMETLWDAKEGSSEHPIIRVTAECSQDCDGGVCKETFPTWVVVHWDVPAREGMPPVRLTYTRDDDGPRPNERWIAALREVFDKHPECGTVASFQEGCKWRCELLVGSKGLMRTASHGSSQMELMPGDRFRDIGNPPEMLPRPLGAPGLGGWTAAIRGGTPPMCNFLDFSGRFSEWYLLGNLASLFPGQTLEYDTISGRVVNNEAADQAARPAYREGWTL